MPCAKIVRKSEYRRATWKNGLGYTDEIAIYPEGSELRRGDFLWRLSSARIERASHFSAFPAHDRTLVILKGNGLKLTHTFEEGDPEETVELAPFSAYDFPGDVPSRCELLSGPVIDLSVFVRKAEAESQTEVLELEAEQTINWMPAGRWNFAFAAEGELEVNTPHDSASYGLSEGNTLRLELDEPLNEDEPVRIRACSATARVVLVGVQG